MQMLSEDDLNLREMTDEELERAWDLWFDLAQSTNDADPPYSHGVLTGLGPEPDRNRRRVPLER
jgi:hypothetical protein